MAPVVDINILKDAPSTCTCTISDHPDQVIKMGGAYMRGLQKDGLMAVSVKHFPGGGCSDVNSHFTTAVNLQTREEWFATYGKVYSELFKDNPASVITFSPTKESQEAAVKVLLGEIEPQGKNPVNLEGFFKREVFPDK